jgi:hypothetical protein
MADVFRRLLITDSPDISSAPPKGVYMCAVLIGGMDRLHREYIETAKSLGVSLKVFAGQERSIRKQLGGADMLILCTGKISHSARKEVVSHASAKKIPLFMIHSSGVSSLRGCIKTRCPSAVPS